MLLEAVKSKTTYLRAGEDLDCDCGKRASVKVSYSPTPTTTGDHWFCGSCHRDYKDDHGE